MCGRYTLRSVIPETLAQALQIEKMPELGAQHNIAPTQMVVAVLHDSKSNKHELQRLRWGLIPSWAKDPAIGAKLINARAETVAKKPAFCFAFKHQRCLILADGFYEWKQENGKKQPFYFRLQNGEIFGFAGLWEVWESPQTGQIKSCTILTTQANDLVQPLHDRMPVILALQDWDVWLNSQVQKPEVLQQLLRPYPPAEMTGYAVSTLVNNPKHNSPECVAPLSAGNDR
jgi:putative SOS response-associated peptidase YedK